MVTSTLLNCRYNQNCVIFADIGKDVQFLIDTGTCWTTCHYSSINKFWQESDFSGAVYTYFGGYSGNKDFGAKHYKYHLKKFQIGDIDLGERDIWVTFDENVNENLLGLDILQDIIFLQIAKTGRFVFFKSMKELQDYILSQMNRS